MEGGRRGPQAGSGTTSDWHPEGLRKLSPPSLPQKTHRRVGRGLGCRPEGPPAESLPPLPVLCVTLGKSPSAVGLLSGVCNRDSAAVTYVSGIPTHLSPLARSCGARPSSHICGNGEVLAPIDLHSSPKIFSLCKFSECIIYFSLKITQSLMETVPICSVSGDCRVGTMPAGHLSSGVSCHTLRGYHRRGFLIP